MLRQQQLEFGLEDPWVGISRAASGPDPWEMSYPEEHRFWSEFHRPNTGYGFDTDIPGGDAIPMYNPDACVPMPYDDLPPGYLCSSPEYGVFALDVYGNVYNRRVQQRVQARVEASEAEAQRVAEASGEIQAERRKSYEYANWVSPMSWVEPSLLPNETQCQDVILAFYDGISSPNNANLSNTTALFAEDFSYSQTHIGLVPGCIADLPPGAGSVGAEEWAESFAKTVSGFGNTTSELVGNATCVPERQVAQGLEEALMFPLMRCEAVHKCTFELKNMLNETGAPVTLEGEITDTVYIDTEGKIFKIKSVFEPSQFTVLGAAEAEEAGGEEGQEGQEGVAAA
jgi:hypothetical protein